MKDTYTLNLTYSQIVNIAEFFEYNLIDNIRNDTNIENIEYVVEMCEIYKMLKAHMNSGKDSENE